MALELLEALKTVAVEVNRSEIEDAVGSLVGRPGGESGPSRERDRDSTGRSEAKGGERRRGGGGGGRPEVLKSENNGSIRWQQAW